MQDLYIFTYLQFKEYVKILLTIFFLAFSYVSYGADFDRNLEETLENLRFPINLKNMRNPVLKFSYGGKFTIDQILSCENGLKLMNSNAASGRGIKLGRKICFLVLAQQAVGNKPLRRLKPLGLDCIFIGLETFDPVEIGGMSKDVGHKKQSWVNRCEGALSFLHETGIKCGAAVLFGLGETQKSRLSLFDQVKDWRMRYSAPSPVSMNWAVQHPLASQEMAGNYDYTEWGTPEGPYLEIFHNFGEASLLYPIHGVRTPSLEELKEIYTRYHCSLVNCHE